MTYLALRVLSRILKIFSTKTLHIISQNLSNIFFNYICNKCFIQSNKSYTNNIFGFWMFLGGREGLRSSRWGS